jgi:hypothetical protein
MSASAKTIGAEQHLEALQQTDCSLFEHLPCGLNVQCRPVAGHGDNEIMWPAAVRGLSTRGLGLVLKRRFEPGTVLSVFVANPRSDSNDSLFVRTDRAVALDGRNWRLDCTFVTPLAPERLDALLKVDVGAQAATDARPGSPLTSPTSTVRVVVTGAVFRVRLGTQEPICRPVTRLYVNDCWPVRTGQAMKVWVGSGPSNDSSADIRVNGCYKQNGVWLIDCYFLGEPPAVLLEKLRTGIM